MNYETFLQKFPIWKTALLDKKYTAQITSTFTLATIGGFWLSLVAIKHCQLVVASSLMTLEPLFILALMTIFYKHKPTKKELIGVFAILFAIFLIYSC